MARNTGEKLPYRLRGDSGGESRNFTDEDFWTRGNFVSTVGLDEKMVREYIRPQERRTSIMMELSHFDGHFFTEPREFRPVKEDCSLS